MHSLHIYQTWFNASADTVQVKPARGNSVFIYLWCPCVLRPWRELFSCPQGLECQSVYFRTINNLPVTVLNVISLFYWHPEPYSGSLVKSFLTCQKFWNNVNMSFLLAKVYFKLDAAFETKRFELLRVKASGGGRFSLKAMRWCSSL